jgi:hypothetical protein
MPDDKTKAVPVASTAEVLETEYRLIWGEPPASAGPDDLGNLAFDRGQAALCLSGGGIRSAAFALGIVQALSRKKLLTGFHYLSSVSGGGYLHGWLQRWIREKDGDAEAVMNALGAEDEPAEIKNLRENSNYLTPRVGIGSNDTWTALAISFRNVSLNWLLFGPLLVLLALIPNIFLTSVVAFPWRVAAAPALLPVFLGLGALGLGTASWFTVRALPSYGSALDVRPGHADGWLMKRIVGPLILWAAAGTYALGHDLWVGPHWFGLAGAAFALVSFGGMFVGLFAAGLTLNGKGGEHDYRRNFLHDVPVWVAAMLFGIAALLAGARLYQALFGPAPFPLPPADRFATSGRAVFLATVGPLWLMGSHLLSATVLAGFRSSAGKSSQPDADREWLARLSAVKIKPMILWTVAGGSALLINWMLSRYLGHLDMSLSALVALVAGGGAVAGGKSEGSGSLVKGMAGRLMKILPMHALIALCTGLFAVSLLVILARLEAMVAAALAPRLAFVETLWEPLHPGVSAHWLIVIVLSLLLYFFSGAIQVNRFSLNGLYRNRLARAFPGGARPERAPNPFTGFDPEDNIRLHKLIPERGGRAVLYPIINVTLNVTHAENLAWQERKAEPFIFSPKFSGSALLDPRPVPPRRERDGAYISSLTYGGNEPDLGMKGCGVSLATAVSISGAAASPNMGYHSSPATAFLMTLFNVRLGAWLPNPALAERLGADVNLSGPNNSLRALLRELAGSTDDKGRDIYLSDGGHFENLALYEMVRRRCRYILVSDAGADPGCAFEDLGNAVRKVKIDLNVDIRFGPMCISSRGRDIQPQFAWALGEVDYGDGRIGQILYIKPSFFGRDLPLDVVAYANKSATFPHETTGDQFFSESQFESYRKLGEYFAGSLAPGMTEATMAAFFAALTPEEKGQEEETSEENLVARVRQWLRRD